MLTTGRYQIDQGALLQKAYHLVSRGFGSRRGALSGVSIAMSGECVASNQKSEGLEICQSTGPRLCRTRYTSPKTISRSVVSTRAPSPGFRCGQCPAGSRLRSEAPRRAPQAQDRRAQMIWRTRRT
jgi:hypothetical protein